MVATWITDMSRRTTHQTTDLEAAQSRAARPQNHGERSFPCLRAHLTELVTLAADCGGEFVGYSWKHCPRENFVMGALYSHAQPCDRHLFCNARVDKHEVQHISLSSGLRRSRSFAFVVSRSSKPCGYTIVRATDFAEAGHHTSCSMSQPAAGRSSNRGREGPTHERDGEVSCGSRGAVVVQPFHVASASWQLVFVVSGTILCHKIVNHSEEDPTVGLTFMSDAAWSARQ